MSQKIGKKILNQALPELNQIKKNLLRLTLHNSNKTLKSFSVLQITLLKDFGTNWNPF
jgi:hypothetical protein